MRITWKPDNREDAAKRIAAHTAVVIRALDEATTNDARRKLFASWLDFAKSNRVCQQIVDHMTDKRRQMIGEENKSTPVARPVPRNVTGERDE